MGDIAVAAVLAGTILLASTVSVELGLSVALIELVAGFVVGNALGLDVPGWLALVGSFAGILLTFLAGAEVDLPQLRRSGRSRSRSESSRLRGRSPPPVYSPTTGSAGTIARPKSPGSRCRRRASPSSTQSWSRPA